MFGDFIKQQRLQRRMTLRSFCSGLEIDPSTWSKVERGLLQPPKNPHTLNRVAQVLGIAANTPEYLEMMDLAALGAGRIPADLLSDVELVKVLPMVFRTVRNSRPSAKELRALAELMRENMPPGRLNPHECET